MKIREETVKKIEERLHEILKLLANQNNQTANTVGMKQETARQHSLMEKQ